MLRYGLYARKSHDDKARTEKSIGEQVAECNALAGRESLFVTWRREESRSARKPGLRQNYAELIALIEKGELDAILCWHVNRLVRNMEEGGKLVQLLIDGKIKEIRTPHATYRSGDNVLPIVVEAASATQFSIDLSHTVVRSTEGKFRAGGWNHKAPQGYRNVRDPLYSKKGLVTLEDPARAMLIRKAWEEFLTGSVSPSEITRRLGIWGYQIRATAKQPARPMRYQAVLAMLQNPFYAGFVRRKGELVKGNHEAIVTVEEFRRAQELLETRTFQGTRTREHAFTGVMRCGYCGQMITAETKKLSSGPWEFYRCSDSRQKCNKCGLSAQQVKDECIRALSDLLVEPEVLAVAVEEMNASIDGMQTSLSAKRTEQASALGAIDTKLKSLTEMWLSGLLTDEERYREIEKEALAKQCELQLAMHVESNEADHMKSNLRACAKHLQLTREWLRSASLDILKCVLQEIGTFTFFGRDRRITFKPRPLLAEVVQNSRSFEPDKLGSGNSLQGAFDRSLCFGRTRGRAFELSEALVKALREDYMPMPETSLLEAIEEAA